MTASLINHSATATETTFPARDCDSPADRALVLVADPDPASRQDRLEALKQAGYRVVAACSGAEMLQLMVQRRPAVALICESLPGLSVEFQVHLSGAEARIPRMATLWIRSGDSPATPAAVEAWIRGSASPLELVAYVQILARLRRAELRCLEFEAQAALQARPHIARPDPPANCDSLGLKGSGRGERPPARADQRQAFDPGSLSAGQLRRLLDLAPEAIAITRDHTLIYVNEAFLNLVRAREASAVLGRSHLDLLHPGYRAQARKRIRRALVEGQVVRSPEERFRRIDGTAIPVEVAAARCETDDGPAVMIFVRDITRRKRLEESLRRRESQLRLIMDSTPALISYVDAEGRYVSVNKSYERHFGFAPEQIQGRHIREVLGEPGWQAAQPFVRRALSGESVAFEQRMPYQHGGPRWVSATYTPDFDETGGVRGFVAQVVDISERKATEAELWASEQRFRQIAQSLSHVFWMTDLCPERVIYVSPAFRDIWGRSPEELYTNPRVWTDAIHADDRPHVIEAFDAWIRAPQGREYRVEFRVIRPDGEIRWVSDRGSLLTNEAGTPVRITGIAEDITARKQAEEALVERTDRYHLVVSGAHDAIWDWDVGRRHVFYSPQWAALRGLDPVEITDSEEEWFSRIHPEDCARVQAGIQSHFRGETPVFAEEYRIVCKDGSSRWLGARGIAQRDRNGRVTRMAGSENDITDRKRMEEAQREGERFKQSVLDALPAHIAVLGADGRIVAVNETWRRFGRENGASGTKRRDIGADYLGVCRAAGDAGDHLALAALDGIQAVLRGDRNCFEFEYPCHSPQEDRWFLMLVRAFPSSGGGAIVTHLDLTAQKSVERALLDTQTDLNQAQAIGQIGNWRLDIWRNHLHWSEENYRIFRVAKGTPLSYETFLDIVHPEDRDYVHRSWAAALQGEPYDIEHRIVVDHATRWVRGRAHLEFGNDGSLRGAFGVTQDITDRKESERKIANLNIDLQRRIMELQAIFDTAPIGLAIAEDSTGTHIRGNPTHARSLGLAPSDEMSAAAANPPALQVLLEGRKLTLDELPMQRAVRGESVRGQIIDIVRADGETVTLHSNCEPLFDEDGQPRGAVGTFLDITQFKRVEGALRASEQRFRAMVQAVPSLTFEGDPAGANTFASESWCSFTGLTATETLGQGWTRALHPDDVPMVAELWTQATLSGTPFESQHRLRRNDGAFRWFISRALPLRGGTGRIERWAGSLTDIDDLVQAEAALRASERRTRQLLEGLPQLVWTCRPDGKCDYVSPQWQHYTGVERQRHLGRSWLRQVHPQDRAHILNRWKAAVVSGGMFEVEVRIRGADGVYHWFQTRAVPLRDEAGLITGWLGADSDIEKLKQAEARLRSADQRKNDFLAMLSHELRNPLAPILSAASVLQAMVSPEPSMQAARDIITRQVAHIRQLVDDLLDVSRITRGQIALKRDTVTIADIVEHAVEACTPMLTERQHRFSVRLPEESVRLEADLVRLVQVATNLLRNACDYTEAGGEIRVTVETECGYVLLRVRDSGIGISPDLLPQIFDLFTQGPRSLARSTGGLGIGLSVAKQLVEMHGGTIMAHSAGPGAGSEFTVRLPRLAGPQASSGKTTTRTGPPNATPLRRVLIVDDNRDAANALSLLLSLEGHAVRQAYDGPNAITTARDFHPDLVLLDIGLPVMDGFEVARNLREMPETRDTTLIAVTGYAEPAILRRSREAGFKRHLIKPVDTQELLDMLLM